MSNLVRYSASVCGEFSVTGFWLCGTLTNFTYTCDFFRKMLGIPQSGWNRKIKTKYNI